MANRIEVKGTLTEVGSRWGTPMAMITVTPTDDGPIIKAPTTTTEEPREVFIPITKGQARELGASLYGTVKLILEVE